MILKPGNIINDKYKVIELLGNGEMGNVYLIEQVNDNKKFAVKEIIFSSDSKPDPVTARKVFLKEVETMAKLEHPRLPKIYDIFSRNEREYIITEYVEGETLEEIIAIANNPLPIEKTIKWTLDLCDVLEYLHNSFHKPITFRDLNPSNIIITSKGKPKLVDFGISRYTSDKDNNTVTYGSPGYSAPEQEKCKGQFTQQSDIYGIGVILFQMLTKYSPDINPFIFPSMKDLNPSIPDELEIIVKRAIELDPRKRYVSIRAFKESLEKFMGMGRYSSQYLSSEADPSKRKSSFTLLEFLIVVAVIAILAAIMFPGLMRPNRGYGKLTSCQSNIKNLATALEMYATDNDGIYPAKLASLTAGHVNKRYIREIPMCMASQNNFYGYILDSNMINYTIFCPSAGVHSSVKREYKGVNYPQYNPQEGLILP